MAFPQVAAVNGGYNAAGTDHTVNLPSGIQADDLLIVIFAADGNPSITFPNEGTDWIQLFEDTSNNYVEFGAWYRIASGSEGSSITVTTSASETSAYTSYRITGYSSVPECATSATGLSDIPDPPEKTASWGSADNLWMAVCGYDRNRYVSAYPTNYTDGRNDYQDSSGGCGVGSAFRELATDTEDPYNFMISSSDDWVANTIVIKPTTGGTIHNVSITESATATDSSDAPGSIYNSAITESASASDSQNAAGSIYNSAITESATASDSQVAVQVLAAAIIESATAGDSQSCQTSYTVDITESATATDSPSAVKILAATITEGATATDTPDAACIYNVVITESATAGDSSDSVKVHQVTITESATATEIQDATMGTIYEVSITETASATDLQGAVKELQASLTESCTAIESQSITGIYNVTIMETASAVESSTVSQTHSVAITELCSATETLNASSVYNVTITESCTATDSQSVITGIILAEVLRLFSRVKKLLKLTSKVE